MSVLSAKVLLTPAAPHEEAAAALGGSSKLSEGQRFERRLVALAVLEKTYLLTGTCLFWEAICQLVLLTLLQLTTSSSLYNLPC